MPATPSNRPDPGPRFDVTRDALSRRHLLALGGGAGAALVLAGCGGNGGSTGGGGTSYKGPKVTLAFWNGFTGGDGAYVEKMVTKFNATNPSIKIDMNIYQWVDLFQKMPAAVASGHGPDVAVMRIDDIPTQSRRMSSRPSTTSRRPYT